MHGRRQRFVRAAGVTGFGLDNRIMLPCERRENRVRILSSDTAKPSFIDVICSL